MHLRTSMSVTVVLEQHAHNLALYVNVTRIFILENKDSRRNLNVSGNPYLLPEITVLILLVFNHCTKVP